MLGFFIGAACLFGLFKVLRHGRGYGSWGHRRGACGQGGWGGCGPGAFRDHDGPSWRGRGGGGFFLRGLFERLDTSPGQEKIIREAVDELRDAGSKFRGELRSTRADIARVMRGPSVDETHLGELFARHDTAIETVRKAAVGSLAKVHEALDERQRTRLADLIESGPGFARGWRGPYREAF